MDKQIEEMKLAPFSSDECPNSADDSDDDVITDYLVSCDGTGPPMANKHGGPGPLVPTISVTPHSPGAKHYPVLEDNLQHLHEIHESIQQMRDQTTIQALNSQILGLTQYARLSASCPSLISEVGSDPDLILSLNSSPTHAVPLGNFGASGFAEILHGKGNSKEWLLNRGDGDIQRRRSWTALEDLSSSADKRKSHRQRSMSLSSLDSEQDDPFLDQADNAGSTRLLVTSPVGSRRATRGTGGASTHSLNEADLQNDFSKIVAKREAEGLNLLPARLPLQKSVSTPSIIAVQDIANEVAIDGTSPVIPPCQRPSGTESETEEEVLAAVKHLIPPNIQISLDEFLNEVAYEQDPGKRRKRGSISSGRKRKRRKRFPTSGSQHAMGQHMLVTGAQRHLPTSQHFIVKIVQLKFIRTPVRTTSQIASNQSCQRVHQKALGFLLQSRQLPRGVHLSPAICRTVPATVRSSMKRRREMVHPMKEQVCPMKYHRTDLSFWEKIP